MIRSLALTASLTMIATLPAGAGQFAIQIDAPYAGASPALMETLRITEIEGLSVGGRHYVVLEAPGEAYVEAFFLTLGLKVRQLNAVDADWTHPAIAELPLSQRLRLLRSIPCESCIG